MVDVIKWMERINGDITVSLTGYSQNLGGLGAGVRLRVERRTSSVVGNSARLSVGIDSLVGCCKSSGGALRLLTHGEEGVFAAPFPLAGDGVFVFLLAGDGVFDATLLFL